MILLDGRCDDPLATKVATLRPWCALEHTTELARFETPMRTRRRRTGSVDSHRRTYPCD
jgi:hypothetical protein